MQRYPLKKLICWFAFFPVLIAAGADSSARVFNVRDFGAVGDGVTLDSAAINQALDACAKAGGGEVLLPEGQYLSGTIHLRSHVTLHLAAEARLLGTTNLALYQQPDVPASLPEARWGKWHRALIVGENLEDVAIAGPGTIDGRKVFDPTGEEHQRGPHTISLLNCRNLSLSNFTIIDAANYAVFLQICDQVTVRDLKIIGGWDGVHFRGGPQRWCRDVSIAGCEFHTGDDSIAGRYWDNVRISHCVMNSSCNGLRLIGPATRLLVTNCTFYGPGLRPHRTGGRVNMLCGILLQPSGWDATEGPLDDVVLANNTMRDVASPVTIWTKPGNPVGRVTIAGLKATGIYRSAFSVESWSDAPITNVVLRDADLEFAGGGTASQALLPVRRPGVDVRPLPSWGIYLRNVEQFTAQNVRLRLAKDDLRPVIDAERVQRLELDEVKFPRVPGVSEPIMTNQVTTLISN